MPRRSKNLKPRHWSTLTCEQQRWYKEWFIPRVVVGIEGDSVFYPERVEYFLHPFEVTALITLLNGHQPSEEYMSACYHMRFTLPRYRIKFEVTRVGPGRPTKGFTAIKSRY